MIRARALALLPLVLPCCATAASEDRRAYILAHPHGWIELTIADRSIPAVPLDQEREDVQTSGPPIQCIVEVRVNGEPLLWERTYPTGEQAPFSTDTGFRFPAPTGAAKANLVYSGCRLNEKGEVASLAYDADIAVEENMTHELVFDGATLRAESPRPNSVVTLEDVYEALTGRRSPAK